MTGRDDGARIIGGVSSARLVLRHIAKHRPDDLINLTPDEASALWYAWHREASAVPNFRITAEERYFVWDTLPDGRQWKLWISQWDRAGVLQILGAASLDTGAR